MAQLFQIEVQNNSSNEPTDLNVTGATGIVVENLGFMPVLLDISSSSEDNSIVNDALFVLVGIASGWLLQPGQRSPVINLDAGQHLLAALVGLGENIEVQAKLQIYTN
jgi:hypothetical protein